MRKGLKMQGLAVLLASGWGCNQSHGPVTPNLPTLETVASGNGQVTVTWNANAPASSYNLYWSTDPAVTLATGTQVTAVGSPYVLTGLTNGIPCYLIVSALTAQGEQPSTVAKATPATAPTALGSAGGWWRKNTVFEQLFVSAFQDGSNLGAAPASNTGNLAGITAAIKANYFTNLGINGLWLSPVFEAGSLTPGSGNKHGYDTIDYMNVAATFGTNQDLSDLISAAHQKNIRVIFDFVVNHTSDQNAWFLDSEGALASPRRDWYLWNSNPSPTYPGDFAGEYWWTPTSASAVPGYAYYGLFAPFMPDLNFNNPDVSATMKGVAKAWFDFGFDGMRVDAVGTLFEGTTPSSNANQPATHAWFDGLRASVVDSYAAGSSPKMMMAETWFYDMPTLLSYVRNTASQAAEFNIVLDFIAPWTFTNAITLAGDPNVATPDAAVAALKSHMISDSTEVESYGGILGVFQSNHDLVASRPATSYQGNGPQLYLAAALNFLGQGMPILYYGNEIAMPASSNNGSGPDTNMRQPFDWPTEAALAATPDSIWQWHQALIKLRTGYGAWNDPAISEVQASDPGILAYKIASANTGKQALVVASLKPSPSTALTVALTGSQVAGLCGNTAGDAFTSATGTLAVSNLPAYGVRVYAVDDAAATYFDHDPVCASYSPILTFPAPTALYLRGTPTAEGWGTCDSLNRMLNNGTVYSVSTPLNAGTTYLFKFADANFGNYNYGAGVAWDAAYPVPAGATVGVGTGTDNLDLAFTPGATRTYTFNFSYGIHPTFWIQ